MSIASHRYGEWSNKFLLTLFNMILKKHRINLKFPKTFIYSKFIWKHKNCTIQCNAEAAKSESPEITLYWSGTHQHSDTTNNPIEELQIANQNKTQANCELTILLLNLIKSKYKKSI